MTNPIRDSAYLERLHAAVEARRPLDAADLVPPEDGEDADLWRSQVQVDAAIAAWKSWREARRRRRRAAASVSAVLAAAGLLFLLGRDADLDRAPEVGTIPPVASAVEPPALMRVPEARRELVAAEAPHPDDVIVAVTDDGDRLAEAAAQAERLAYAFRPVSDRVGDVMRLLIDAVPGADGFLL